jgi:spore coat polysaccharide biosynthesis predicted glycosyltransferase SpsG
MIKKIYFHANASKTEGSGHVMRMYALAEEAKSRNLETVLIGKISDVPWIGKELLDKVFDIVIQDLSDIPPDLGECLLIWDSYYINESLLKITDLPFLRRYVIADSATPLQMADGVFLLEDSLAWTEYLHREEIQFLNGRQLVPVRQSHQVGTNFKPSQSESNLEVLIFAGGVEYGTFVPSLSESILETFPEVRVTAISSNEGFYSSDRLIIRQPTHQFDQYLDAADLVICSASSSILEVISRRIPSGFVTTTDNQFSNRDFLIKEGLSVEVGLFKNNQFVLDSDALTRLFMDVETRRELQKSCALKFQGLGSKLILNSMLSGIRT